ncbi:MAG TPA: aminotransferase class I/II-fold pyridoxal phosphate-dependent enzyme [Chitinophagaceae bacterium]|jgi:8-amino-7-oxononanoate synthase|nr:aminotransferase class I/II-fold pyridoxal phosphate-dependent enzyme [Chitinophagaceae bacterium]
MFQFTKLPNRVAFVKQQEYLFFSGYAYLGVQHHQQFLELVNEGVEKLGWLFPSSRISNTQLSIFDEFEAMLSSLTNTAKTISFSSGFAAGTVASRLFEGATTMTCSEAHPAVKKYTTVDLDFTAWSKEVVETLQTNNFKTPPVLIVDAVNPLTSTVNDFNFLNKINQSIIVLIDDSHGIGLLGKNGEGISGLVPRKNNIEYIFTYSLSKAFSINGGAISCSNLATAQLIETLPEYTASTGIAPSLLYAFIHGQNIYAAQRNQLQKNIHYLRHLLAENKSITNQEDIPVFLLPEHLDEAYFSARQIIVSSFAYPNPQGKKINRAVLNALHTQDDLQKLATAIHS